jgi:2,4-dienoyl-CoA reductase-like NADH-dependent reductase (Old Yellow Enzyme family)
VCFDVNVFRFLLTPRTDEYGGSFENRIRFSVEVVKEVRSAMPDTMPLFVRISATEYNDNGWDIYDSVKLSRIYKELGTLGLFVCLFVCLSVCQFVLVLSKNMDYL